MDAASCTAALFMLVGSAYVHSLMDGAVRDYLRDSHSCERAFVCV